MLQGEKAAGRTVFFNDKEFTGFLHTNVVVEGVCVDTGGNFRLCQFLVKQFGKGPFPEGITEEGILIGEGSKVH